MSIQQNRTVGAATVNMLDGWCTMQKRTENGAAGAFLAELSCCSALEHGGMMIPAAALVQSAAQNMDRLDRPESPLPTLVTAFGPAICGSPMMGPSPGLAGYPGVRPLLGAAGVPWTPKLL